MIRDNSIKEITTLLLKFKERANSEYLFPVLESEARVLILTNPYAFCVAACLDRGAKADIIWTIPYWINKIAGHFDPIKFGLDSSKTIVDLFNQLPKKPHYINAAPKTFQSITEMVVDQFEGDASKIWTNQPASTVKLLFLEIYGVGNGISNMIPLLLEEAYKFRFSDIDHSLMDIKPDVHTMRVLYRLGISKSNIEEDAIKAARLLNPPYPGEIDGPLWYIGRNWCKSGNPICHECILGKLCIKRVD